MSADSLAAHARRQRRLEEARSYFLGFLPIGVSLALGFVAGTI